MSELLGRVIKMPPTDAILVGRNATSDIVLDGESVSQRHARFELRGGRWWVVDLDSTNGLHVNDELTQRAELKCGDRVRIGGTILKLVCPGKTPVFPRELMFDDRQLIYRPTKIDGLTGLTNRRIFLERLDAEEKRALDQGPPLTLAMIDIDHFKRVNDTFGHPAGDRVLKQLASLAKHRQRPEDTLARYGGEEFVWLMPNTDLPGAVAQVDAFRKQIEGHPFTFENQTISITISAGVSQLGPDAAPRKLFEQADQRLHEAKNGGRNRVAS